MRTHKLHGVLLAGVNGHKIYAKGDELRIVGRNSSYKTVLPESKDVVMKYVNLRYYPLEQQQQIRLEFLKLLDVEGLI